MPAWYLVTGELKPRLIKAAESVKWEPASNGKRMLDWLTNMGDWDISRKRYYGMPLRFILPECGHFNCSRLKAGAQGAWGRGVDEMPELHSPG